MLVFLIYPQNARILTIMPAMFLCCRWEVARVAARSPPPPTLRTGQTARKTTSTERNSGPPRTVNIAWPTRRICAKYFYFRTRHLISSFCLILLSKGKLGQNTKQKNQMKGRIGENVTKFTTKVMSTRPIDQHFTTCLQPTPAF